MLDYDNEVVTTTVSVNHFVKVRNLIQEEWLSQKKNESLHGIPVDPELEKIREIYEETYNHLNQVERGLSNE